MVRFGSNSEKVSNNYIRSMKDKENTEVLDIERKKSIILLSVLALVAVMSGFAITAFATDTVDGESQFPALFGNREFGCGRGRSRCGMFGAIEVSEEYEFNAITIAENDEDVATLLTEEYTIVGVRPMIKSFVDGDGDVTTTATTAVVVLKKEDATERAVVWVDLNTDSVTKIVILTRTVIEKDVGTIEVNTP